MLRRKASRRAESNVKFANHAALRGCRIKMVAAASRNFRVEHATRVLSAATRRRHPMLVRS